MIPQQSIPKLVVPNVIQNRCGLLHIKHTMMQYICFMSVTSYACYCFAKDCFTGGCILSLDCMSEEKLKKKKKKLTKKNTLMVYDDFWATPFSSSEMSQPKQK